jgi:type I restriction enzyme R subunit
VQIYEPGPDDPIVPPDAPPADDDEPIPPTPGPDETFVLDPNIDWTGHDDNTPYRKTYVDGVSVSVVAERVEYLDAYGRLVTESLRDFTKHTLQKRFGSLDAFLSQWKAEARKREIVEQLAEEGVLLEALAEEVGKDLDPFDLICHVAFDQPPLTRRQRAEHVRRRDDVFTKYGPQARVVLEALLQKYQDEGETNLDDPRILQIRPFDAMGTPVELIRRFGTRRDFERAVAELQSALYEGVA